MICDYIICDKVFDKISPMIHRERERERERWREGERNSGATRVQSATQYYIVLVIDWIDIDSTSFTTSEKKIHVET